MRADSSRRSTGDGAEKLYREVLELARDGRDNASRTHADTAAAGLEALGSSPR